MKKRKKQTHCYKNKNAFDSKKPLFEKKTRSTKKVFGIVKKHPDGFGFLISDQDHQEDVYLSPSEMKGILSDDQIEVGVFYRRGRSYGRVIRILERKRKSVLGQLSFVSKKIGCIKDEDHFFGSDLFFETKNHSSLKEGDWIEVKITSYPQSKKGFFGVIQKVVGSFPDAWSDNMRMLKKFNIPFSFSHSYCHLQKKYKSQSPFSSSDLKQRSDLRKMPFVTIDGADAKDFDDAICVDKKESGYMLWVSIADVDFYVKEKTLLDQEAFTRGNSTYFPNFVSPMLPSFLSQDFCSLKPNVSRLTMTAQIQLNAQADVENAWFYPSVICSQHQFTYAQVQSILDGEIKKSISKKVLQSIQQASQLAQVLRNRRFKNGSIDLDIAESKIHLDSKGYPLDIVESKRLFSHQLIEELMLIANQAVACFLDKKLMIYRVHDIPELKDVKNLKKLFHLIDTKKSFSYLATAKKPLSIQQQVISLTQSIKNHPKKSIFHQLILRSLPQACYSTNNKGHFGLNFRNYTHFTSPIRRYADLVVHRLLKQKLGLKAHSSYNKKELERKAKFLGECERRSVKAEREIDSIKKARWIKSFLGKEFNGFISSVTQFGFFVTLHQYPVDGLVHIRSLPERWTFDPVQMILRSRRSKFIFRQGDRVLIQVASANEQTGKIDFRFQKKYFAKEDK